MASKAAMVEVRGLEPLASSVRGRRSTRLSYTPWKHFAAYRTDAGVCAGGSSGPCGRTGRCRMGSSLAT